MAASTTITETKDADNIMLGLGVLGLADLPRTSPDTYNDVGYIKAAGFEYSREVKDFESAGVLIKRVVFRDKFSLKAEFAEVSIDTFHKIIQGTKNGAGDTETFGGHRNITRFALRFEHTNDDGRIVQVDMFRCAPTGTFSFNFAEEDFIKYPVEFAAEADDAMSAGQRYGRIRVLS